MNARSPWREPLWLAVWLLATLGVRPLLVPDEGRYAGVARDMLQGGDWLVPRLDGLPFFHKPPLMYWIDAAAMTLFRANPFAARLAPAAGAWLMGTAAWFAWRRWHGEAQARVALAVLATAPFFFVGAQYANHDMLVAGCIAAAVFAFAQADASGARRLWQLGWLACALGLLAKGLIGVVLPLAVVGPWLLARGRWRSVLAGLHPWHWLPALVVAAPWFLAMQARFPGFFDYFFVEQHFRRYTETGFNNAQPWWFFLAVLPLLTLPWALFAPRALRDAWRAPDARTGLYAWWLVLVLGFFSLPASKLVGYVLPALPAWCALVAVSLDAGRALWRRVAVGAALLGVAAVGVLAWHSPRSARDAGLALAAARAPGEAVVFVDAMFYDLPFYARLDRPAIVAADWSDPAIARSDNWRKELLDAARFDAAAGARVLVSLGQLDALACVDGRRSWFVVRTGKAPAALGAARVAFRGREATLLRVDACPAGVG